MQRNFSRWETILNQLQILLGKVGRLNCRQLACYTLYLTETAEHQDPSMLLRRAKCLLTSALPDTRKQTFFFPQTAQHPHTQAMQILYA